MTGGPSWRWVGAALWLLAAGCYLSTAIHPGDAGPGPGDGGDAADGHGDSDAGPETDSDRDDEQVGPNDADTDAQDADRSDEPCVPGPELCNGMDDDCDDAVDEELSRSCGTVCGTGIEQCVDGLWSACTAPAPGLSPAVTATRERPKNSDARAEIITGSPGGQKPTSLWANQGRWQGFSGYV